MKKLEVFDPAMCCSTGVCGVEVDPVLAQFAADLKWVAEHGIAVERHNLGQEHRLLLPILLLLRKWKPVSTVCRFLLLMVISSRPVCTHHASSWHRNLPFN